MAEDRPVCTIVIGWGAIAVAVLMAFSGAMAMFAKFTIGDLPESGTQATGVDFVFKHFEAFAALQVCCAVLLFAAGRALLSLRRWASRVIEGVAWLGLVFLILEVLWFIQEFRGAVISASRPPDASFVGMMVAMMAFIVLFWSTPLILTIRSLRSERVQRVLG